MPVLREKLQGEVDRQFGHADREVFVTSGTSGGIMLAMLVLLNPGEEVIVFDPYFVMYDALAAVAGAKVVYVDTYPDFHIDLDRVAAAITPRTKMIVLEQPRQSNRGRGHGGRSPRRRPVGGQRNIVLVER